MRRGQITHAPDPPVWTWTTVPGAPLASKIRNSAAVATFAVAIRREAAIARHRIRGPGLTRFEPLASPMPVPRRHYTAGRTVRSWSRTRTTGSDRLHATRPSGKGGDNAD